MGSINTSDKECVQPLSVSVVKCGEVVSEANINKLTSLTKKKNQLLSVCHSIGSHATTMSIDHIHMRSRRAYFVIPHLLAKYIKGNQEWQDSIPEHAHRHMSET